jgi:hypothetical protein
VRAHHAQLFLDFVHQPVKLSMLDAVRHHRGDLVQNTVRAQQMVVIGA